MADASMQCYYLDGARNQQGPVAGADIARMIRGGAINRDTLIWHPGMTDWRPAGQVNEFASLFGASAPPGPPPMRPPMAPAGAAPAVRAPGTAAPSFGGYDPHAAVGYAGAGYDGKSMGFGNAIATCFRKYADFSGRATRPEFWFFALFQFLALIAIVIIGAIVAALNEDAGLALMVVGCIIAVLGFFLPSLAVTVRRLHDADMSGWFVLLTFVPILAIGTICYIVFGCLPGTAGPNRFGPQA